MKEHDGSALRIEPPTLLGGETRVERDAFGAEWLVLPTERRQEKLPGERAELLRALDAVDTPIAAQSFVRGHGLLFHGPSDAGEIREAWDDWQREIRRIQFVTLMTGYLRRAMAGDVRAIAELRYEIPTSAAVGDDAELLKEVSLLVQGIVNEHLAANRWAIDAGPLIGLDLDVFVYAARPPNALAFAYFELADLLVARAPLRRCEGCGRLFVPRKRGDQRFHDDACRQRTGYQRRNAEKERDQT